jgi:hypothetical protein
MDFDSTFASINEYGGVDYAPHNKGVTPVFFVEAVQDHAASEREGRTVYVDKERVRLYVVGDSATVATHPVDAGIIARFRDQYEAWKRKQTGSHIVGMPLSKWPMATPGMVRECESLNIFSVEDLAAVSDGNIQNMTNGRSIREKAIAWLKSATDGAAIMKYAAESQRLREDLGLAMERIAILEGKKSAMRSEAIPREVARELVKKKPIRRKWPQNKKDGRKAAWTPERRKAAAEAVKARGGIRSLTGGVATALLADVEV